MGQLLSKKTSTPFRVLPPVRDWPAPQPPLALSPGTPNFASSPYSCSFHLPASSIPPHLVLRTSAWAFIFSLSCSRGKLDTFLHPLPPHPLGLGPKATPSGSAPHSSHPPHLQKFPGNRCGEEWTGRCS